MSSILSQAVEVLPKQYRTEQTFSMPVALLIEMHNSFGKGHTMRETIRSYIQSYGKANAKAHWTRAVVEKADETLYFDQDLYRQAVYRGKQETYLELAQDAYKQLHKAVEFISTFQKEEDSAIKALEAGVAGAPLVEVANYSPQTALLRQNTSSLDALAEQMLDGLVNNVAQLSSPQKILNQKKPQLTRPVSKAKKQPASKK
jgi:hypothetical protein